MTELLENGGNLSADTINNLVSKGFTEFATAMPDEYSSLLSNAMSSVYDEFSDFLSNYGSTVPEGFEDDWNAYVSSAVSALDMVGISAE